METETSMLNLGSQAAALMVLTAARCGLPATARTRAPAQPDFERSAIGHLWSNMKKRWLSANDCKG